MSDAQKPSKEMLENLDLLMNMDILKDESDWSMLKTFNFAKVKTPAPTPSPAPEKDDSHEP